MQCDDRRTARAEWRRHTRRAGRNARVFEERPTRRIAIAFAIANRSRIEVTMISSASMQDHFGLALATAPGGIRSRTVRREPTSRANVGLVPLTHREDSIVRAGQPAAVSHLLRSPQRLGWKWNRRFDAGRDKEVPR